jgi:hypothetical protein
VLAPLRDPRRSPAAVLPVDDGGGGTTLAESDAAGLPVFAPLELTAGGGGTTSEAPKILPTKLLRSDPLPDCVGGGGTTALAVSAVLPFASRRMSREMSEEGGGAMTVGDGNVSLGSRVAIRSGAETGGGTTATLAICTGEVETWRLTAPGAGGITLEASDGAERACSRETLGAGATTFGVSEGEDDIRSRETLGAGGITDGASNGA